MGQARVVWAMREYGRLQLAMVAGRVEKGWNYGCVEGRKASGNELDLLSKNVKGY
jgi:hypothetical protein